VKSDSSFAEVGRQLLQTALDWARGRDVEALIVPATDSRETDLYESMGFTDAGRSTHDGVEYTWYRIVLQRVDR
jgi:hypothetical protein